MRLFEWKTRHAEDAALVHHHGSVFSALHDQRRGPHLENVLGRDAGREARRIRSEEHTSELQSPDHLVCRLLLEKKNKLEHSIIPLLQYEVVCLKVI